MKGLARGSWRELLFGTFLGVVSILGAYYYFYWPVDDAYISIRYALNWSLYGELLYNRFEGDAGLVQGFSNPGMLPIYRLLIEWAPDLMLALKLVGCALFAGTSMLTYGIGRRLALGRPYAASAALAIAASPALSVHAVSGLETIFLAFFLALSVWLLFSRGQVAKLLSAPTFAYCTTLRPEGLALGTLLICLFIASRASWLRLREWREPPLFGSRGFLWFGSFTCLWICFLAWQLLRYASIHPNTAITKAEGLWSFGSFLDGDRYKYLYDFLAYNPAYGVLLFVALLTFAFGLLVRRSLLRGTPLLLLAIPGPALAFLGRDDYFTNFRYLAPYLVLVFLFVACALESLVRGLRRMLPLTAALLVLFVWGVVRDAMTDVVSNDRSSFSWDVRRTEKVTPHPRVGFGSYWAPFPQQCDLLALYVPEGGVACYGNIGRPGINARDVQILDSVGLVSREFALFRTGSVEGRIAVDRLLEHLSPSVYVAGTGDLQLLELIRRKTATGFKEVAWLSECQERVFLSESLLARDEGARVPLETRIRREREIFEMLPGDYFAAWRYRDVLYVGQCVRELCALRSRFEGRRSYAGLVAPLQSLREADSREEPGLRASAPSPGLVCEPQGVSFSLRGERLATFRTWHLRLRAAPMAECDVEVRLRRPTTEVVLARRGILTNAAGHARLSVVFDRCGLLFRDSGSSQILHPIIFHASLGLPVAESKQHAVVVLPTNLPVLVEEEARIGLRVTAPGSPEWTLTMVR